MALIGQGEQNKSDESEAGISCQFQFSQYQPPEVDSVVTVQYQMLPWHIRGYL